MSDATPSLPDEVRQRIDTHLDAIERVLLQANVSRPERRNIVDEVESQIYDMLAARPDQAPSAAIVEILAQLDPAEAYSPEARTTAAVPAEPTRATRGSGYSPRELWQRMRGWWSFESGVRRLSPPAALGIAWVATVVFLLLAALSFRWPPEPLMMLLLLTGLTAPVGVTILGFLALRRIRRADSSEYGLRLALIETFFFPLVCANLALIGILAASETVGLVLLAALVIIAANIGLARFAWRRYGEQFLSRVQSW